MVERLTERKTENADSLKIRIATAREEMKRITEFDYVVVNQDDCQDEAVDKIVAIISAEHCRIGRTPVLI